jgi:hypothetical protein
MVGKCAYMAAVAAVVTCAPVSILGLALCHSVRSDSLQHTYLYLRPAAHGVSCWLLVSDCMHGLSPASLSVGCDFF